MKSGLNRPILMTLVAVALAIAGCGSDGNDQFYGSLQNFGNTYQCNGFCALGSLPSFNQLGVQTNSDIRISFNEAVDLASLQPAGGTPAFKLIRVGSTAVDMTSTLSFTGSSGNTILIFAPATPLILNANYKFTLLTSLRSVSGRPLYSQVDLPFSTGDGTNTGGAGQNKPGQPPAIASTQPLAGYDQNGSACMGFLVRFTEPLRQPPTAFISAEGFWGLFNYPEQQASVDKYDANGLFWKIGAECNPSHLGAGSIIGVTVLYAIDYDNEEFTTPASSRCTMNISGGCNPR